MNPTWYFVAESLSSIINILSIGFIQLTDVVEPHHRAAAYGLFYGAFMGGIAVAPFFAAVMSHVHIAIFSCAVRLSALLIAILFLPDTLPMEMRSYTEQEESQSNRHPIPGVGGVVHAMMRPFREMAILRSSTTLLLLTTGAFVSKMAFSADVTLFFFYAENNLGVTDTDVANMMFVTGLLGALVQGVLLKYLISLLGERGLLLASFVSGTIHNVIYGLASQKWMLYIGLSVSPFSNTNNPTCGPFPCTIVTVWSRMMGARDFSPSRTLRR